MSPEEFLLVPGLAVLVIHGTKLAVGGGVLHGECQPLHLLLRCPEIRLHPGGGGRRPVAPLGQVLQTSDAMLRQEFSVSAARFKFSMVAQCLYPALCWALILFWMSMSRLGFPVRCFGWREGLGLPAIRVPGPPLRSRRPRSSIG